MLPVTYQEDNVSDVNVIVQHDVSIQKSQYNVGYYEDIDIILLDMNEAREEEKEEFEDFISDEDGN